MKEKKSYKAIWIIGSIALTIIGFAVIPVLIDKCGKKLYKSSLKNEEIDFDNMGPEIVKNES